MDKLIATNFIFENERGTKIHGQITFPFISGIVYKPIKIIISGGIFDSNFKTLTGNASEKIRNEKLKLIEKYTKEKSCDTYEITEPFIFSFKPTGLVQFMSIMNGFNANREGKLLFDEKIFNKREVKIGKFFQNLKNAKANTGVLEVINLSDAFVLAPDYFESLEKYYDVNIKSSSYKKLEGK